MLESSARRAAAPLGFETAALSGIGDDIPIASALQRDEANPPRPPTSFSSPRYPQWAV